MTCSEDGTIRTWDIEGKLHGVNNSLPCRRICKVRDLKTGLKVNVNVARYTHDAKIILCISSDGSI
jgi:WD40 repeat protein